MLLYGAALLCALAGGAVAIASRCSEPVVPAHPIVPVAVDAGVDAGPRPIAHDDFVPDLPEVPDLATQPPPPAVVADPRSSQLGAEMRLLSRAREELAQHPAEALALLDQHRHYHPDGVLREEREAAAIEALVALERSAEAERRYYDFLRDYPQSEYRARLEDVMRRPPHPVGEHGR